MVKKTKKSKAGEEMVITIARFGADPQNVTIPTGSTVAEVLDLAGVTVKKNWEMFVDGEDATGADILQNADILSIVTPKEAGTR